MHKQKTLLERIKRLEKVNDEQSFIDGVFYIMKYFNISYDDVMNMPMCAFNECIRFIINVSKKKPMSKHNNVKGLKNG